MQWRRRLVNKEIVEQASKLEAAVAFTDCFDFLSVECYLVAANTEADTMRTIALIIGLMTLTAAGCWAADWPAQMTLGGFQISNIRGTANADGSGTATGTLQIPGLGNANVSLTRSVRGDVNGTASVDSRAVRGSFALSSGGLRGRGSVECPPKTIDSSAISISPRGEATGSGRLSLGRLSASVDFSVSGNSCSLNGAAPVRAQADTAVASYKFDGRLAIQGGGGRISATVSGRVERTGKLAKQVTTFNIPNTSVDVSNGQCAINVGGVSVTFTLF